jgi:hypothetical protein
LEKLPEAVVEAGIRPPALFVIGPAVAHAAKLDWFGSRPLFGERIVVIAPAPKLVESLEFYGAEVLEVPIPISPGARVAINALPLTGCVLRSAADVEVLDEERDSEAWSQEVVSWCLNQDASGRARQLGWSSVKGLPDGEPEESLVGEILKGRGLASGRQ